MSVQVVSVLLERPGLELEAVNVRGKILIIISHQYIQNMYHISIFFITGQTAVEVAQARGHLQVELMNQ